MQRISQELDLNKENNPGGHLSKLSPCDKQLIAHQISPGKLDKGVQATQFINTVIHNTVIPKPVRNALKNTGFCSVMKKKVPVLRKTVH